MTAVRDAAGGPVEVRDFGLLHAAVARPSATVFGQDAYPDLFTKAAAPLHSLVRNDALVDGNKRVAWAGAWVFLEVNGERLGDPLDVDAAAAEHVAGVHAREPVGRDVLLQRHISRHHEQLDRDSVRETDPQQRDQQGRVPSNVSGTTSTKVTATPVSRGRRGCRRAASNPPASEPAVCAAGTKPHDERPIVSSATGGPSTWMSPAFTALITAKLRPRARGEPAPALGEFREPAGAPAAGSRGSPVRRP